MGEILSAEDIANTRAAAMNVYHEAPDPFMRGMLRILDSHEALRARLAEVEQALRRYGQHDVVCPLNLPHMAAHLTVVVAPTDCTCGLIAVLDKGEPDERDPERRRVGAGGDPMSKGETL